MILKTAQEHESLTFSLGQYIAILVDISQYWALWMNTYVHFSAHL